MNRIRQTISLALVAALISLGLVTSAEAQRRPYRITDRQVDNLIRRLEQSTDRFKSSLDSALDRSRYDGTRAEDNINHFVEHFEKATDQLRQRFDRRASVASDVENVLRQATDINQFMLRNRFGGRVMNDWVMVRNDVNALARAYNVTWNWNQQTSTVTPNRPYRMTDMQVETIIRRVENNADRFKRSLDQALDRSRYDGTRAEDNINQFIQNFEAATDQLRDRFDDRKSVASDVENVLRQATYIDDFMRRNRLAQRAVSNWQFLRNDLNDLASAYSVAWNWDVRTLPAPGGVFTAQGDLTGTYRIDPARSDNPTTAAERATRNLPYNERQRVYDDVVRRLESPQMLAIDRNGQNVVIASSRAPQMTIQADGRVNREQLPNGSFSRVTARFEGDNLVISSAGNRATDFNVTFEPLNNGQQLRVTREIWNERLGVNPVIVQNVYNKTADVARWDIFEGEDQTATTGSSGEFIVPNNQTLVATLNTDLTTQEARVGDRFTMTVRQPSQFEGAVIEGRIASVDRSGRATGRSELSFNFDTIRLRNGQTYNFAGFIESVRTPEGEVVRVDNESTVRDDNRTETTVKRGAIGAAVGAIIGAIAGGAQGAAIGAAIGAGAGAGSVYVQGREDLQLPVGTELTIRASAPNR